MRSAREAAETAVAGIAFAGTLNPMQVVARHAYALTFEKEHVVERAMELYRGMWGGHGPEEDEGLQEIMNTR